jgi:hypothetical protein
LATGAWALVIALADESAAVESRELEEFAELSSFASRAVEFWGLACENAGADEIARAEARTKIGREGRLMVFPSRTEMFERVRRQCQQAKQGIPLGEFSVVARKTSAKVTHGQSFVSR